MTKDGEKSREVYIYQKDGTFLRLEREGFPSGYIVFHNRTEANSFIYMDFDKKNSIDVFKKNPEYLFDETGYLDRLIDACFEEIEKAYSDGKIHQGLKIFNSMQNVAYGLDYLRSKIDIPDSVSDAKIIKAIKAFEDDLRKPKLSGDDIRNLVGVFEKKVGGKYKGVGDSYNKYNVNQAVKYYNREKTLDEKIWHAESALRIPPQTEYAKKKQKMLMDSIKKKTNLDYSKDRIRYEVIHKWRPDIEFKYSVKTDVCNAITFDDKGRIQRLHWDSSHRILHSLDDIDRDFVVKILFYHDRYTRLIDMDYPFLYENKSSLPPRN